MGGSGATTTGRLRRSDPSHCLRALLRTVLNGTRWHQNGTMHATACSGDGSNEQPRAGGQAYAAATASGVLSELAPAKPQVSAIRSTNELLNTPSRQLPALAHFGEPTSGLEPSFWSAVVSSPSSPGVLDSGEPCWMSHTVAQM